MPWVDHILPRPAHQSIRCSAVEHIIPVPSILFIPAPIPIQIIVARFAIELIIIIPAAHKIIPIPREERVISLIPKEFIRSRAR